MRKPACKKGKPCKDVCIPRSHTCSGEGRSATAEEIKEKLRRIEDSIRNKPLEYAYIVDPNTGEVSGPIGGKNARMVSIPSKLVRGGIVTHNHPVPPELMSTPEYRDGFGLSREDILNSVAQGCSEIRAVTPGHTYSMKFPPDNPGGLRGAISASRTYEKMRIEVESDFLSKVRTGETTIEVANAEYHHEIAKRTAIQMGFEYSRTEKRKDGIPPDVDFARLDAARKGRKCGKSYIPATRKCRVGMVGTALGSKAAATALPTKTGRLTSDEADLLGAGRISRLQAAGVGAGVVLGGMGIAALAVTAYVKKDLKESSIDFNSIRQPPGGVPDEQTMKKYETFKEGDIIRKVFRNEGKLGIRHHYGVYVGKDPKTGEHMVIDSGENWKTRSNTPFVQKRGLNWSASPNDTEWEAVPEKEINERIEAGMGRRIPREEIVHRAKSLLGAELTYKGFESNCDSLAWTIATGDSTGQQSRKLGSLTRFLASAVTDSALKIEVSSDAFPGGNVKPGVQIGPYKVTGITHYGKSKTRMTTRQMADFLVQQRALEVRRTLWEGIKNPYSGQIENPDAVRVEPGRSVQVAEVERVPIRYEELGTYMKDEMTSMMLADKYRDGGRKELRGDSPETDLDELLLLLGIETPSVFQQKVDTILSEAGGTSATLRRQQLYKQYIMLVLGMVSQLHGGSLTEGGEDREDAKSKKCGKGYIPLKAKCRKGMGTLMSKKTKNVAAIAAIAATGAVVAAGGLFALNSIKKDLKASSVDPSNFRFTEDGKPDEEAIKEYDKFKPGDVIRNSFKRTGGYSSHYAIYAGKDKRTGEHLAYGVAVGGPSRSQVSLSPLHDRPRKEASLYQRVPDEELVPSTGRRYSRLETVRRANELTGKTLRYNMLRDNCEHWARAISTGEKSSSQAGGVRPTRVSTVASDIISAVASRLDPVTSTANQESTETMLNHLRRLEMQRSHGTGESRFVLAENFSFQPSIYMPLSGNKLDIKAEVKPSIGSPNVDIKATATATGTMSPSATFTSNVTGINRVMGGGGSGGEGKKALIENINLNPKVSFPGGGNEANVSFNFSPSILSPTVTGSSNATANLSALSPSVNGKVDLLGADLSKVDLAKVIPNPFSREPGKKDSVDGVSEDLTLKVIEAIGLKTPSEFESGLKAISSPFGASGRFFEEACIRNYLMMLALGVRFLAEKNTEDKSDAVQAAMTEGAIARTLARVLSRSYTDGVDRILSIKSKGDVYYGHFLGDGKVVAYQLDLGKDQISTQISKTRRDTARLDGIRDEVKRFDALRNKRSRRQCSVGLSCGGTCISRSKVCKVSLNRLSSPIERTTLKEGLRLFQDPIPLGTGPVPQEVGTPRYYSPADNPDAGIRELKLAAQERGVYRYGAMNKKELRNAIRAVDENPQQNERIRRSIERKQEAKRVTEGSRFADYANDWIKARKIMRIAGTGGPLAIAAAGAWVIGSTRREYTRAVDDYRSGFQESAQQATAMAAKLPSQRVNQPNMMFVVGGYQAEKGSVSKIRRAFDRLEKEEGGAGGWFNKENHIFEFSLNASDIPLPKGMRRMKGGRYTDEYVGYLGRQAAMGTIFPKGIKGRLIKEVAGLKGGRNEDAVRLAAQIYSQARHSEPRQEKLEDKTNAELRKELVKYGVRADPRETKTTLISRLYDIGAGDEEFVNSNLPINVVAYGGGAHAAREAMEILSRMEGGRDILDRVNLATISAPDFGFTKQIAAEVSLRSRHDPLTETLPTRAERTVNTVKSRELDDYLGDREVTNIIRQHFGYERTSAFQRELERRRSRQRLLDLQDQEERRQEALRNRKSQRSSGTGEADIPAQSEGSAPTRTGGRNRKKNAPAGVTAEAVSP